MALRRSPLLFALASLLGSISALAAPPAPVSVVDGAVPIAFRRARGPMGRAAGVTAPAAVPVVVRYSRPVSKADLDALRALGATEVERFRDQPGLRPMARGGLLPRLALADVPASAFGAIASLEGVARVTLDGSLFAPPRPLDFTSKDTQAAGVWRSRGADGLSIDGHGVTVCDIDSGIDPFHPLFFRADGNGGKPYMAWVDLNGDGAFSPGVDGVDLLGDGAAIVLRVLNSTTTGIYDPAPLFGTDDPALDVGFDYLYADQNGSGAREHGPAAGFTEATPTYGEQLFVVDDVNGNGALDLGEKLVALGTSKIKAARRDKKVYRRGENLIELPVTDEAFHGTGASGVLVGGVPGLTRLTGMAPGADLVMASNTDGTSDLKLAKFCRDEGARVVLHEYAPWYGHPLDGSTVMEQLIDESSAEGISHINPAGNLSGSEKAYKRAIEPGATTTVNVTTPEGWGFGFFGATLLWRDPSRSLAIEVEAPNGITTPLPNDAAPLYEPWQDGLMVYSAREVSARGTVHVDFYLFGDSPNSPKIPEGTWKLHVTDPAQPGADEITLIGFVADDLSGWGKGIHFPEHTTEDHFIGYPGTADHGMPIAAYTGHGHWGAEPGLRAPYSGRGFRVDGEPILWISAPDDPITPGTREGVQALHVIYGGTSGASPHVAGGAALLLAQNPTWTGDDVKEAIRKGALADDAVLSSGPVPNTDYGHGKLRIHESLFGEPPAGGSAPSITIAELTVEQGDPALVTIAASDADEPAAGLVLELDRDYDGTFEETLDAPELSVPTATLGTFVSKVRVTDATGRTSAALARVNVVPEGSLPDPEPEPKPEETEEVVVGGGGACSVPAGQTGTLGGAAAGLLALLTLLRLRRRAS